MQLQAPSSTHYLVGTWNERSFGPKAAYQYIGRRNDCPIDWMGSSVHKGHSSDAQHALQGSNPIIPRCLCQSECLQIREGMTVVSTIPSSPSEELDRILILKIFSSIGRCRFLDEKNFDACTALSGSGPAFACIFLEAMADGGVMMGLPRVEALELAAQSKILMRFHCLCSHSTALQGAARMVLQAGAHPAQIRDAVTSKLMYKENKYSKLTHNLPAPGGCTIAGLLALEDGRVRSTIARCIQVATERASELGQPSKK